jgi:glyoxylase-like metal-dependent hydrolase (beta-lactamase superfamily II)
MSSDSSCQYQAVKTDGGWLLHAGDAYFHRAALVGGAVPAGLEAFEGMVEQDRQARLDTVTRLRSLPAEVAVVCSHDPVEFAAVRGPQRVEAVDSVEDLTPSLRSAAPTA